ncbi:MAG TPA: hypothetical protein VNC22_01935, partial [Sporichthya sp.]|nr:hypothetical protein [Sporichthya sp.]
MATITAPATHRARAGSTDPLSKKLGWSTLNLLAVLYAVIPVLWIASLSFKPAASVTDGNFVPRDWTLDNYRSIFDTSEFTRALINSIGIALIATTLA